MTLLLPQLAAFKDKGAFVVEDDFHWLISPHLWTTVLTGSGAAATVANGPGGIVPLTTATTSNNESMIKTTNKPFLFAASKPAFFGCQMQYAEANTNTAGIVLGFSSAHATLELTDTAGALVSSFTGAVFYKTTGSLFWHVACSVGSTVQDTITNISTTGATPALFTIEFNPLSTTNADVIYSINGQQVRDSNNRLIKHNFVYTSAVAMGPGVFVKNYTSSGTTEIVNLDYIAAAQLR